MSEDPSPSVLGAWFDFEKLRSQAESRLHDLELSKFTLSYGAKDEADFRQRLKEVQALLDKMMALIGPPSQVSQDRSVM